MLSFGHIQENRMTIETLNYVSIPKWISIVPKDLGGAGTTEDVTNGTRLFANTRPKNIEVRNYYS